MSSPLAVAFNINTPPPHCYRVNDTGIFRRHCSCAADVLASGVVQIVPRVTHFCARSPLWLLPSRPRLWRSNGSRQLTTGRSAPAPFKAGHFLAPRGSHHGQRLVISRASLSGRSPPRGCDHRSTRTTIYHSWKLIIEGNAQACCHRNPG